MTWEQRLLRARRVGHFSQVDKGLVREWPSCAVGEKYHIKRKKGGMEISILNVNMEIENLGLDFMRAINKDEVYTALILYDKIQWSARRKPK
jgi:hypothetical protein